MKKIIYLAMLIASFSFATPVVSQAKVHHKHHATRTRVVYKTRTVTAPARDHGINANAGVQLGPIHVGAGAGVGAH